MPDGQKKEAERHAAQRLDDVARDQHDADLGKQVSTFEAMVRGMWDLLGGKEEGETDDAHLPQSR